MDYCGETGYLAIMKSEARGAQQMPWTGPWKMHFWKKPSYDEFGFANGHVDIIIWLYENQTEGCSVEAMENAASQGRLDSVKWLNDKINHGCFGRSLIFAAQN